MTGGGLLALWGALYVFIARPPRRHGPPLPQRRLARHRSGAVPDGLRPDDGSGSPWRPCLSLTAADGVRPRPPIVVGRRAASWYRLPRVDSDAATPTPDDDAARRSDVDQWGRSEHLRGLDARALRPDLPVLVPRRVGRLRTAAREPAARCSSRTTPARSRRTRPRSCTASRPQLGRPVYGLAEYLFRALPVRRHAVVARSAASPRIPTTRTGCCTTNSNSRSCSPKAPRRPASSSRERYQLRRFGRGGFVEIAMRAGVPVIPLAVVGAEESMPILFKSTRLAKLLNIPYFPDHREHADVRPGRARSTYFPAKFKIRVLPTGALRRPAQPGALLAQPGDGGVRAHPPHGAGRALRHAAQAAQRLVRVSSDARPRHRLEHVLGRARRAGARATARRRGRSSGSTREIPRVPLERTEFVRADSSYSILARIVRATEIDTIAAHAPDRRLDACQRAHAARDQRDRHDEPARGRGRAREPGAQGRREELGARLRRELPGPERVPRGHDRARARRAPAVERSLLEVEAFLRDFAEDNPHVVVTLLRFANVLGNDIDTPFAHALKRRVVAGDPRLRPPRAVRARRRRRRRAHVRDHATTCPASSTSPATATCRGARCARSSAAGASRSRRCSPPGRPSRCGSLGVWDLPPEALMLLRYGRTIDNAPLQARRLPLRVHERGHGRSVRAGAAARGRRSATTNPTYQYQRDVEDLLPPLARRRATRSSSRWNTFGSTTRDGVALVTLVDRAAPQRDDRADGERDRRDLRRARGRRVDRRGRDHRRAARVLQRRRRRSLGAVAGGRDDGERRQIASIYEGFLRVLRSPLPTVAAVNGPAVGAGMNLALACDVRHRGRLGPVRRPVPADRPAPGRRPHLDARAGRRPPGRGGDRAVRRADRRPACRRDRPRLALPCPTTSCSTPRARFAAERGAASRRRCRRAAKADAAASPVAARLRRRARDRGRPPGLVARPRLVRQAVSDVPIDRTAAGPMTCDRREPRIGQ